MAQSEKTLVLVADDEPSMLAMVSSHLRAKGYRVLEASDGDHAWELAHEHLPDVVVLDVMMPGMSGWEVCRKIREAVSLAHTGVVMLTGIGETLNEMTSPLYGADAYIDKPFEFSELDSKIRETAARRRAGAIGRADTGEVDEEWAAIEEATRPGVGAALPKPKRAPIGEVTRPGVGAALPKPAPKRVSQRPPPAGAPKSQKAPSSAAKSPPEPRSHQSKPKAVGRKAPKARAASRSAKSSGAPKSAARRATARGKPATTSKARASTAAAGKARPKAKASGKRPAKRAKPSKKAAAKKKARR